MTFLNNRARAVTGAPVPYAANAVDNQGAVYLILGSDMGMSDGKEGFISFWWDRQLAGQTQRILNTTNFRFVTNLRWDGATTLKFRTVGRNTGGTAILNVDSSTDFNASTGWHHFMASWDLTQAAVPADAVQQYIDDASDISITTVTNDTLDYTDTDWAVLSDPGGSDIADLFMADFMFHDSYLDIDVEANRRKLIDGSGKPVDLGSDGSNVFGTTPLVFLSGVTASWHTNKGTGGGFTQNGGSLTTAPSSPSD